MKRIDFTALLNNAERHGLKNIRTLVADLVTKYRHNRKMLDRIKLAISEKANSSCFTVDNPKAYIYLSLVFKYRNL